MFLNKNKKLKYEGFENKVEEGVEEEFEEGVEEEEEVEVEEEVEGEVEGEEGVEGEGGVEGEEGVEGENGVEGEKDLIYYENIPLQNYKVKGEYNIDNIQSVDKNHFGCFGRETPVIYTKVESERFTNQKWSAKGELSSEISSQGDIIKGRMCNQKWGSPECIKREPNKIIQSILDQPKINSLRGYHKNPEMYSYDFIHYSNDVPIPINTTFFS